MKKSYLLIYGIVVATMYSCRNDVVIAENLDILLEEKLTEASAGEGVDFFKLPDTDAYENIPQDPNNPLTREKVELGKLLYHETQLSDRAKYPQGVFTYSCATCHHAPGGFQAGRIQGISDGGIGFGIRGEGRDMNPIYDEDSIDIQPIRTPTVMNSAYQQVMLWNGQFGATGPNEGTEANWTAGTPKAENHLGFEGVETQAIAGLTVHRMHINYDFIENSDYKLLFDYAFPEMAFEERYSPISAGLAIAAYERTVLANQAPFQNWLRGNYSAMTDDQKLGAILFFGKANCVACHTGPALSTMDFFALGMNDFDPSEVFGPTPDEATRKGRGGFTGNPVDDYKFKTTQLYSLGYSPFYGHGSSFRSIRDVVDYKNRAVKENSNVPDGQLADEFVPLSLSEDEVDQITNFIRFGLDDANLSRYEPSALPSENCFPNNDPLSKIDLGCY